MIVLYLLRVVVGEGDYLGASWLWARLQAYRGHSEVTTTVLPRYIRYVLLPYMVAAIK